MNIHISHTSMLNNEKSMSIINNKRKNVDGSNININKEENITKNIIKHIKKINSMLLEIFVILPIYNFVLLFSLFYYGYNKNHDLYMVQNIDGNWYYQCNLNKLNFILNIIDFLILLIILIKGTCLLKYEGIFKFIKYIILSLFIGIVFGPLINVNNNNINNIYIYIIFLFFFFFIKFFLIIYNYLKIIFSNF